MRLALLLLAGCLAETAGVVPCGDVACSAGDTCTPSGCATPDEVAACITAGDGAACATTDITRGACRGGACRAAVCGDGIVELDERCDDGNDVSGDGCSSDCKSDETCGNGVVDPIAGEDCDDGNALSNDGCDSRCKRELPVWSDVSPSPLSARQQHALAYDASRGVVVAFGGENTTDHLGDTWEWDGTRWHARTPLASPPRRAGHAMTYDPVRRVVLLFGGIGDSGGLADTWTWDGSTWTQIETAATPPAAGALAFDDRRGVAVLFDGETWEWNGVTWTRRELANPPIGGSLAYDSARGVLVLAGAQTWEYDGTAWTARATTPSSYGVLAYDPSRARSVLYGGFIAGVATDRTWEWDGAQWTEITVTPRPSARLGTAMVYGAHSLLLFGGGVFTNNAASVFADTWSRAGTAWSLEPALAVAPTPRTSAAGAYDPLRGNVLLVGGWEIDTDTLRGDLWQWRDGAWTARSDAGSIPPRLLHAAAFDARRGKLVVFGGFTWGAPPYGDTWEWDDTQWIQKQPAVSPSPRHGAAMTYDGTHVVLFGGVDSTLHADTWIWDGTTWTDVSPPSSPPARGRASLAYDPVRARVVLFGGCTNTFGGSGCFDDVWEWDGSAWTEVAAPVRPTPREQATLAYDAQRRRIVMTGGYSESGGQLGDTWEWDGHAWTQLETAVRPPIRDSAAAAYDAAHRELVMFGGDGITGSLGDTWQLRYEAPLQPSERCVLATADEDGDGLAGCADPDCWGRCAPLCPPGAACDPAAPRCGDGTCSAVEDHLICPADCR